ncbi:MAG TPA: Fic family protein [Acidimicrobiia bacterium]|nr:Fic family protein [Acidimicrobiia bacterium]
MSKLVKRRWVADYSPGLPRRDRATCDYEAYVPDSLVSRPVRLDGDVAADVADAEAAVTRFDARAVALADTEALARLLLRAESVASSKIEGLEVGGQRLLRAEAASELGEDARDVTATEVLGNIQAMTWALGIVRRGDDITVDHLLEAHRRLLAGTRLHEYRGMIREEQNWIGGSSFNPCSASFVPPPPELVRDLMDDLCAFCNADGLPTIVQAAIAHAQFETIHPFVDGNGRIGRALIHLVLRRRGLAVRVLPPISLILATWSDDYVARLTATRYIGKPTSDAAAEATNQWVALFATACRRAIEDAETFEQRVSTLQGRWRERLGKVRAKSAADLLIGALPGAPIVTVNGAAKLIGRTYQATNAAIDRLVEAKILKQITVGQRNRAFETPELVRTFADLERRLASPAGNTRSPPPTRPVPRRR